MLYQYRCLKCHQEIEEFSPQFWASQPPKALCRPCTRQILHEKAGSWMAFAAGLIFLGSLPLWASTPASTSTRNPDATRSRVAPRSVDRKVGTGAFRIQRQGEDVLMQPMLVPAFKLALIKGPMPSGAEVQVCSVWARDMQKDDEARTILTVMVLRCGETEYGVSEVDFRFDGSEKASK